MEASLKQNKRLALWKSVKKHRQLYLMFIPVALFFAVFCYAPLYGITLAFKEYSIKYGISGSKWIGFENFKILFEQVKFRQVLRNTIVISVLRLVITFPIPIVIAVLFSEMRSKRYKTVLQTFMYLPHFISWVIMAKLVKDLISIDGGVINKIIEAFGGEPKAFILDPNSFYGILLSSEVIKEVGWSTIIYTAAITSVPLNLYEAAELDGCNRFRKIIHITIPCISSTILIMFVLAIGNIMNAGFDSIFNLYNPAVYSTADILDTYLYRIGLNEGEFELATALGLFKSLINFGLLLGANFAVKKITGAGIYE